MSEQNQLTGQQVMLFELVANLIGDTPRAFQMGENHISPEDIADIPFLSRTLEVIYQLEASAVPPTFDAVRNVLIADGSENYAFMLGGINDSGERTGLMQYKYDEHPDIFGVSYAIKQYYLANNKNRKAFIQVQEILSAPEGLPADRMMKAIDHLMSLNITNSADEPLYTQVTAIDAWMKRVRDNFQRASEGRAVGPSWQFNGLKNLVPVMKRGDVTTFMGKSGWGKTSFGGVFGEHWAWKQDYDVYVFLFETQVEDYVARQIARNCWIPTKDVTNLNWHPGMEDHLATNRYNDFIAGAIENEEIGSIHYQPCAGWSPAKLEAGIEVMTRMSEMRGREAVFVIDYFQKIDVSKWKHTVTPYNELASWLKTLVSRRNLYMMVLAQEKEGSGEENKLPKWGDEILKQSQVVMRLQRNIATTDAPIMQNGTALKDSMGNDRYYHRAGGWDSMLSLQVIKANDDSPGSVKLRAENNLFKFSEIETSSSTGDRQER